MKKLIAILLLMTMSFTMSWSISSKTLRDSYPPNTTLTAISTANVIRPEKTAREDITRASVIDSAFGAKITRMNTYTSGYLYPKLQSWNSDMSLVYIGYRLFDANTLEESPITKYLTRDESFSKVGSPIGNEFHWSYVNPKVFYTLQGLNRDDHKYTFTKNTIKGNDIEHISLFNFEKYNFEKITLSMGESHFDKYDRWIVFTAKKQNDDHVYALLCNMQQPQRECKMKKLPNTTWGSVFIEGSERSLYDWISMSPNGDHIIENTTINGSEYVGQHLNNANAPETGIFMYDLNFENKQRIAMTGGHGDIGLDENGNQVYVQVEWLANHYGFYSYNLDAPVGQREKKLLSNTYGGGHISCQNYQRPGWCYLSTRALGYREVFSLKLDGSGTVNRFVKTHNTDYYSPMGGVSPDGKRVLFKSNLGGSEGVYHASLSSNDNENITTPTIALTQDTYTPNENVSVDISGNLSGDQDWVGIYPVGSNNSWGNVIAWHWVNSGTNIIDNIQYTTNHDMPAGEYEARLFFHNSYNDEARVAFTVAGGEESYEDYGTYDVVGPEKLPNEERIYIYKPKKNGIVRTNAPVVIYSKGGYYDQGSSSLESSENFMKYIVSKGYVVIGVHTAFNSENEFQRILSALNQLGNTVDKSKIGLIGASSGGGTIFYHLRRLKEENYASTSFLMSLDGYASSDRTDKVRLLDTTTLLLQFGGADGLDYSGHDNGAISGIETRYQDPRILMALYNILPGNEKSLSFLDNHIHGYVSGSMNGKGDLLEKVGAMLAYKFENGGQNARNIVLNNNKYDEINNNKLGYDKYRYKCDEYGYHYCDVFNPTQNF